MKKIALAGAFALSAATAQASPLTEYFTAFAVVGDSLSDNGNTAALLTQLQPFLPAPVPPSPPPTPEELKAAANFERLREPGVFSDGFTWARSFVDAFENANKTGANLAFAGATAVDNSATGDPVPDLFAQIFAPPALPFPVPATISTYPDGIGGLLLPPASPTSLPALNGARTLGNKPLTTVFIGGNDFLNAAGGLDQNAPDFTPLITAMQVAQGTLQAGLQTLVSAGIRDLIVMNLPDFGLIPRFKDAPEAFRTQLSAIAGQYNQALETFLEGNNLFGATVTQVDVYDALSDTDLLAAIGITNSTDACVATVSLTATSCEGFLFFDDIHPTSSGHALIAAATRDALNESYPALVPLPAPALMLLTALGGLVTLRRRKVV